MYMDAVVIAGIATVLLMVGFFVGVGIFVMKDQKAPFLTPSGILKSAASCSSPRETRSMRA